MSRARGGRWNSGFWAGFAGTMLSPMTAMAQGYYAKVASSAFVAGTISQITGGKFANGAWSGAFRFMFNEAMHKILKPSEYNYRVGEAAVEEKNRLSDLNAAGLSNKLNVNVSDDLEAFVLKKKLINDLDKILIYSAGKATQNAAESYYYGLKDFASGNALDRIRAGIDLIFSTVGPKSDYGFIYECPSISNCHVKGVYQK